MKKMFPKFHSLSSDTFLAPMAKITDSAFRELCKEYGCGLTFTEMISANDLARKEPQSWKEVEALKLESSPKGIQLYGRNMENFITATKIVQPFADVVDLNFGCPYYKIVQQGCGSAFLARPGKIQQVVQNVVANSQIPVSCKLRLGLDEKNITVLEAAQACAVKGASLIIVHARTANQEYSGNADWSWIKKVKECLEKNNFKIPLCGNGDVRSVEDYLRMKQETNCDYVMIGRGAIGNPFIFQQIKDYNKTGKYILPTKKEKLDALERYLFLAEKFKLDFLQIKQQTMYFLERTLPDRMFKKKLEEVKILEQLRELLWKISI